MIFFGEHSLWHLGCRLRNTFDWRPQGHKVYLRLSSHFKNFKITLIYIPMFLPLTTNCCVYEDSLEDPKVTDSLFKLHPLVKLWIQAITEGRTIESDFHQSNEFEYLLPQTGNDNPPTTTSSILSLRFLLNSPLKDLGDIYTLNTFQLNTYNFFETYSTLRSGYLPPKTPVAPSKATHNKISQPTTTYPTMEISPPSTINVTPDDTSQVSAAPSNLTTTSLDNTSITTTPSVLSKFLKFVAMVRLLFPSLFLDAADNISQLNPPTLTPNFIKRISFATLSKDLSRQLIELIDAHPAKSIRRVGILSSEFLIHHQLIMHSWVTSLELSSRPSPSPKSWTAWNSFTLFTWTPSPFSTGKEYQLHLRKKLDNEADHMLEQPETKQDVVVR